MYRKPTNIAQAFWGFLYIMYFLCTLLTYTEPENAINLNVFVVFLHTFSVGEKGKYGHGRIFYSLVSYITKTLRPSKYKIHK